MSSKTTYRAEPTQIIEGQYLDQHKLMRLLRDVYGTSDEGKNNFHVEVGFSYIYLLYIYQRPNYGGALTKLHPQLRLNRYKIYPSKHVIDAPVLTKVQISR